jgi:hypothetical protein
MYWNYGGEKPLIDSCGMIGKHVDTSAMSSCELAVISRAGVVADGLIN